MTGANGTSGRGDPGVADQVAALPIRWDEDGKLSILLVTSRDTGRWVMPKGWTEAGLTYSEAASLEALEEAGAKGPISERAIGQYRYRKQGSKGSSVYCRVHLFPMLVQELQPDWKERDERTRRWFSAVDAANSVDEPDLAELLQTLSKNPEGQPVISELLEAS